MNGVVGADVAELRVLATALDQAGERLVAIHGDLTRRTTVVNDTDGTR